MDHRIKLFGIIALVGFIAGVIAALAYEKLIPWLKEVLPSFSNYTVYIVAGIVGAIIAVILIFIWAAVSGKKDQRW